MKTKATLIFAILSALCATVALTSCGAAERVVLSDAERADGVRIFREMGFKFKVSSDWAKYQETVTCVTGIGDTESAEEPVFSGRYYSYLSNKYLAQYEEAIATIEDEEALYARIDEIVAHEKVIMKMAAYRKAKIDEAGFSALTKCKYNEKLAEFGDLALYFSYNDFDGTDLEEGETELVKSLYADAAATRASMKTFKPETIQESIAGIKNFSFALKGLDGAEYTQDMFKGKKLTIVNVWATWCGPCKRELPHFGPLAAELEKDNVQFVGILSDGKDLEKNPEVPGLAREILAKAGVSYVNLLPDADMQIRKDLLDSITGIPTTFFVDGNGMVVGEVIVGSFDSREELMAAIQETLDSLN